VNLVVTNTAFAYVHWTAELIPVGVFILAMFLTLLIATGLAAGERIRFGKLSRRRPESALLAFKGSSAPTPAMYRGTPGSAPREVEALGGYEYVHRIETPLQGIFGFSADVDPPRFVSYPDALVFIDNDEYTIIPWDSVCELLHISCFSTNDGQVFGLDRKLSHLGPLYERLQSVIKQRALPRAWETLAAGGSVVFHPLVEPRFPGLNAVLEKAILSTTLHAPFTVSRAGIGYGVKALPWSQVTGITVVNVTRSGILMDKVLAIRAAGRIFDWCRVSLHSVPNEDALVELIRRSCPESVLAKPGIQFW
jgi:hypothetical protein